MSKALAKRLSNCWRRVSPPTVRSLLRCWDTLTETITPKTGRTSTNIHATVNGSRAVPVEVSPANTSATQANAGTTTAPMIPLRYAKRLVRACSSAHSAAEKELKSSWSVTSHPPQTGVRLARRATTLIRLPCLSSMPPANLSISLRLSAAQPAAMRRRREDLGPTLPPEHQSPSHSTHIPSLAAGRATSPWNPALRDQGA